MKGRCWGGAFSGLTTPTGRASALLSLIRQHFRKKERDAETVGAEDERCGEELLVPSTE